MGGQNSPPLAEAGEDRTVALGPVALDASGSSDPDGDPISYTWTFQTIPAGSTSALSGGSTETPTFIADVPGNYVCRLIVSDGISDSEADEVTIHATPFGLSPFSRIIGAGLQYGGTATLGNPAHGGVTVRVESGDPSVALIARDGLTPGAAFQEIPVPDGEDTVDYTVQGVSGARGDVIVTASAPGFFEGTGTIQVVEPAVTVEALEAIQSVGTDSDFTVRLGIPDAAGATLSGIQAASAANIPPLVVTLSSSDGVVGHVSAAGDNDATVALETTVGSSEASATFVPIARGATTVSASIPGFMTTDAGFQAILVDPPSLSPFSRTIGAGLQYSNNADLEIADHGGVTVLIESDDPWVALISVDAATPGSEFIEVFVPDGSTTADYTVQGAAGAAGEVTVTASAPGFLNGTGTITVVQPGVMIFGLADTRSVGSNDTFTVLVGIPNAGGTGLSGYQGMSAANDPVKVLTLESSQGAVGELTFGGPISDTVQLDMTAGMFQPGATFVPLTTGLTTVTASIPGFLSTTSAVLDVTITDP
jgi:hypothetical protein